MSLDAPQFYPDSSPTTLILFDVTECETAARFHEQRAVWGPDSDVEMLDLDHAVLIVRPGFASEDAA